MLFTKLKLDLFSMFVNPNVLSLKINMNLNEWKSDTNEASFDQTTFLFAHPRQCLSHVSETLYFVCSFSSKTTSTTQSIVGDCTAWARAPPNPRTPSPARARRRPTTSTDRALDPPSGTRTCFKTQPADPHHMLSDVPRQDFTKCIFV